MAITAAMVKELRERTGVGMMECKKALTESDGDIDSAIEALRKKGAAKADKKSGRIAAEGVIAVDISADMKSGTMLEVNCETDFVARDEGFLGFIDNILKIIVEQQPADISALNSLELDTATVEGARQELVAKIGENISIRRFDRIEAPEGGTVQAYQHGHRIAVMVSSTGGRPDLGKDLAMHVAATKPVCVDRADVPQQTINKEREIFMAQAQESGKPEEIMQKMVEGKIQKYLNEVTLLGQPFVKDPDQTISKLLTSENAKVKQFLRYEVGEGIEKRVDDFVAEVMSQAKG